MDTITIQILPGLWTGTCIISDNADQVGIVYNITNPEFKCEKLGGLYPGRKYIATFSDNDKVELTKCITPFLET